MSEKRDIPLTVNLTKSEEHVLDKLMALHNVGYSEMIGKAIKVYNNLEKLIDSYERQ